MAGLTDIAAQSGFSAGTQGSVNVPGAAALYQSYLYPTLGPIAGVGQIGPFSFDDEQDDTVIGANTITDHFVENNEAVQDHIGVEPFRVTLKGVVSELVFSQASEGLVLSALQTVENTLSQADAYLGKYTPGATQALLSAISQAQNVAVQIEQAASRAAQIASFFLTGPASNRQQAAYAQLSALRLARTIFTVYTPFQVFYNMAIENIQATQPALSTTKSAFTVTMKQIQFTSSLSSSSFSAQYGGNAAYGYQPQAPNGATSGASALLSSVTNGFTSAATIPTALF
jgi:hypothetical protein